MVRRIASGEAEVYLCQRKPFEASLQIGADNLRSRSRTHDHRTRIGEARQQRVRRAIAQKRQRLLRPSHRNVVQASSGVSILATADAIPGAIEYYNVPELQALRPVSAEQQHSVLPPPELPTPLREPLDEVRCRQFGT